MIKYLLLSFLLISISFGIEINAQTQFDNASFEDWEEIGFGPEFIEPIEWSSIKSTDNADINVQTPHNWDRSEFGNAHSGNYSVYLHTVRLFGINATGTISNGRYHAEFNINNGYVYTDTIDSKWHTKISAKPDSLVGWYKANPSGIDFPTVKVVLHTGYAQISEISDTLTYVASAKLNLPNEVVDQWERFSLPINYYNENMPEYALIILTSSNGTSAVDLSEAWFDDIEFIYNDGTGITEKDSDKLEVNIHNNQLSVLLRTNKKENYALSIHDINGKLLLNDFGITGQKNYYNLGLRSGIYIVSVNYNGKVLTKKIIL